MPINIFLAHLSSLSSLGFAFIIVHAHLQLRVGVIKLEVGRVEDNVEGRPDGQVGLNERRQLSRIGVAILCMSRNIRFEQLNLFQIVCQLELHWDSRAGDVRF